MCFTIGAHTSAYAECRSVAEATQRPQTTSWLKWFDVDRMATTATAAAVAATALIYIHKNSHIHVCIQRIARTWTLEPSASDRLNAAECLVCESNNKFLVFISFFFATPTWNLLSFDSQKIARETIVWEENDKHSRLSRAPMRGECERALAFAILFHFLLFLLWCIYVPI